MTRVMLIGAHGMLGTAFREFFAAVAGGPASTAGEGVSAPVELIARDLPEVDLHRPATVAAAVAAARPEVILNCTGWTDVDGAEAHEAEALALNGAGPAQLAARAREAGALLVHFSTDYVFDGRKNAPYLPGDAPAPLSAYGRTKLAGERAIRESGVRALVVRAAWLYAPWGKNFVRTIRRAAREKEFLEVVDDQVGSPTYALDLAAASWRLAGAGRTGLVQLVNSGQASWLDFAREIVRLSGRATPVRPTTTDRLARPARRPAYSVLASDVALRPWTEALAECMGRLAEAGE